MEVAESDGEVAGNVGLPLAEGGGVGVILPIVDDIHNDRLSSFHSCSTYVVVRAEETQCGWR